MIQKHFFLSNQDKFNQTDLILFKQQLEGLTDKQLELLPTLSDSLKTPSTMLIFSLLLGSYGVDRFLLGQTGWGILKLLTLGALGFWTMVDWFTVQKRTKDYNRQKFIEFMNNIKIMEN